MDNKKQDISITIGIVAWFVIAITLATLIC